MYEKITGYLDTFSKGAADPEIKEKISSFVSDFSQSGFMNPNAMEIVGEKGWVDRGALKNATPTMSAEDACACLSCFVQQEYFLEGISLDLISNGLLIGILQRLKELDG